MSAEYLTLSLPSELDVSPITLHRVQREGKGDIDVAVADGQGGEHDRAIIVPLTSGGQHYIDAFGGGKIKWLPEVRHVRVPESQEIYGDALQWAFQS